MAYTDRDWDNTGTKVTKEDFKRMETGIKTNDAAITEQANQINVLKDSPNFTGSPTIQGQQIATSAKTSFSCTPASGFTITAQNCYKINNEVVFNVDIKRTDGADITPTTQLLFTVPYKPLSEFPVTNVSRSVQYGLMNCFSQSIVNTNGQVWVMNNSTCGYFSISGRFEI